MNPPWIISTSVLDFLQLNFTIIAMTTLPQISITFPTSSILPNEFGKVPINCCSLSSKNTCSFHPRRLKLRLYGERWSFLGGGNGKDGVLVKDDGWKKKKRVVVVRLNQGSGFNGGGGKDDGGTARIVGNLALAIGLTYLSMTGQLGWVLDAIVSIWLLVILVPIVGLGALIWWAGRDIVQDACPNCGNEFQIFKSALNDDLELCPFCSQPFSVVGNEFVSNSVKSSNQSTTFGQAFGDMFPRSKKEKDFSTAIVDIEAEIKDVD